MWHGTGSKDLETRPLASIRSWWKTGESEREERKGWGEGGVTKRRSHIVPHREQLSRSEERRGRRRGRLLVGYQLARPIERNLSEIRAHTNPAEEKGRTQPPPLECRGSTSKRFRKAPKGPTRPFPFRVLLHCFVPRQFARRDSALGKGIPAPGNFLFQRQPVEDKLNAKKSSA